MTLIRQSKAKLQFKMNNMNSTDIIFCHILAVSSNGVIGNNNQLIWHYPEDLKYFKKITSEKVIIMGRKTYESFGSKPLPNRYHIVISKHADQLNQQLPIEFSNQVCFVNGITESFKLAKKIHQDKNLLSNECMIIGGGEIYNQTFENVQKIYLSRIDKNFNGDTKYNLSKLSNFFLDKSTKSLTHEELCFEIWIKK